MDRRWRSAGPATGFRRPCANGCGFGMAGARSPAATTCLWITRRITCWPGPREAAQASATLASHADGTTASDTPQHGGRLTPPGTSHRVGSHLPDARIPANNKTGNLHTGRSTSEMGMKAGSWNRPTGWTNVPVPSDPERPGRHCQWIPFLTGHCLSRRRITLRVPAGCPPPSVTFLLTGRRRAPASLERQRTTARHPAVVRRARAIKISVLRARDLGPAAQGSRYKASARAPVRILRSRWRAGRMR